MENNPDEGRTPYCKHKGACLNSLLKDGSKIALFSYLIKAGLSTVFGLKRIFKTPSTLFKILFGKDAIKFGLFVGTFVCVFRSIMCGLRRCID